MLTRFDEILDREAPVKKKKIAKQTKATEPRYDPVQLGDDTSVGSTMLVVEVMEMFGLKDPKNVIMACLLGKVAARKAGCLPGELGGTWLIDRDSAIERWGK